jgi:transcriptional regulator with XRE-family HTH domain
MTDLQDFVQRLGTTLRTLRKARRWTQADVAERLGGDVALETISRFERANAVPSLAWIDRLARLYDISIDDLLRQTLTPPREGPLSPAQHLMETTHTLSDLEATVVSDIVVAYIAEVTRRRGT